MINSTNAHDSAASEWSLRSATLSPLQKFGNWAWTQAVGSKNTIGNYWNSCSGSTRGSFIGLGAAVPAYAIGATVLGALSGAALAGATALAVGTTTYRYLNNQGPLPTAIKTDKAAATAFEATPPTPESTEKSDEEQIEDALLDTPLVKAASLDAERRMYKKNKTIQPLTPALNLELQPGIKNESPTLLQRCAARIALIWHSIVETFSWYGSKQKLVMEKLAELAEGTDNFIEKMYYIELRSQVGSLAKNSDPIELIQTIDGTGERLEALALRVEERIDSLVGDRQAADEFYRKCMEDLARLQNLPCTQVQRAWFTGRLTNSFRRLDDLFSRDGAALHRYCGCHVQPEDPANGIKDLAPGISEQKGKFNVAHPEHVDHTGMPAHTSAVLLSWSLGGGHNVVQHAMSQRIAEKGGHAYKVEADKEVVEGFFNLRKWTGYSGVEWSDFFIRTGSWRIISFLNWMTRGSDTPESREDKIKRFALSLLARGDQDVAVMSFTRYTSAAEKAAGRLGIGCYDVATDLDFEVFDFNKNAENPYFRHALMVSDPKRQAKDLDRMLEPHQVVEGGFPVREAFLRSYTKEELDGLRRKYAEQYGLSPDARVVVLLYGGAGMPNTLAETLAEQYSNQPGAPKVHLFAICGKDEQKKNQLKARFDSLNNSTFKATAFGWTNENTLGELYAMAALDKDRQGYLVSSKGGGGSLSEAIARGLPTLVYDTADLWQETKNISFLTEKGLGKTFKKESELPTLLAQSLQIPFAPEKAPNGEAYSQFNSKRKSMEQLGNLVKEARADAKFQQRKPSQVRLPQMAALLSAESSK
jgi:UDP-N-acetylglucosamine:LPS N-acetylglucosamine transferase